VDNARHRGDGHAGLARHINNRRGHVSLVTSVASCKRLQSYDNILANSCQ
jgi:hypothetical protein